MLRSTVGSSRSKTCSQSKLPSSGPPSPAPRLRLFGVRRFAPSGGVEAMLCGSNASEFVAINASDESDARFRERSKFSTVLCARSINPFEGGRWRLRRMRASGCTDLTAMGIESFFVCSLLILLGLVVLPREILLSGVFLVLTSLSPEEYGADWCSFLLSPVRIGSPSILKASREVAHPAQ